MRLQETKENIIIYRRKYDKLYCPREWKNVVGSLKLGTSHKNMYYIKQVNKQVSTLQYTSKKNTDTIPETKHKT